MRFLLGFGSCAIGVGAEEVAESLEILLQNTDYVLEKVGCNGLCFAEPVLQIINDDGEDAFYGYLNPDSACQVVKEALLGQKYSQNLLCDELRFLEPQKRLVLRNMGLIDPEKIADYIQRDGYQALEQALSMPREDIIKIIDDAQLRSRVGDGVCVGQKWHSVNESPLQEKYIICNIDPGDSGAFVDRSLLEGDPHGILEGIIIAGYAIQAKMAFIYINDEYDLPILRLEKALQQARQLGYLGNNILAEGWDFNIEIVYKKRESFFRDLARDYINTARFMDDGETFANIPWIISHGSQAFASIGTENSKGTKVFSLAGQVERGGLIEIPMGFTLRDVIYQIGNGLQTNKPFKAVQLGGPWGIFFPENLLDTPIDYRNILAMGGAIGSGVLMVIDSTDCIIDIVNYFIELSLQESCGVCFQCYDGLRQIKDIFARIIIGQGQKSDIEALENLCYYVKEKAYCILGNYATNPVLTTIQYFPQEYLDHINDKICSALKCRRLLTYEIDGLKCVGCAICGEHCSSRAISGRYKKLHYIDEAKCDHCGECLDYCHFNAINIKSIKKDI